MPKIVAISQVEDLQAWEKAVRTHGDLFRRQTIRGRYEYTTVADENRIVMCAEVDDVDTFFKELKSQDAEDAKDFDGIKRESLQFFVLDKVFKF